MWWGKVDIDCEPGACVVRCHRDASNSGDDMSSRKLVKGSDEGTDPIKNGIEGLMGQVSAGIEEKILNRVRGELNEKLSAAISDAVKEAKADYRRLHEFVGEIDKKVDEAATRYVDSRLRASVSAEVRQFWGNFILAEVEKAVNVRMQNIVMDVAMKVKQLL